MRRPFFRFAGLYENATHENYRLLFFLTILFLSCGKNKKCNQEDSFTGIVVQQLIIPGGLPNENIARVGNSNGFFINSDSLYKLVFFQTTNLPFIDFTKHDILGQYGSGACNISFHKEVMSDSTTNRYHYTLSVYECYTYHQKLCISFNWVIVPKLPQGWTVTFESIKHR